MPPEEVELYILSSAPKKHLMAVGKERPQICLLTCPPSKDGAIPQTACSLVV